MWVCLAVVLTIGFLIHQDISMKFIVPKYPSSNLLVAQGFRCRWTYQTYSLQHYSRCFAQNVAIDESSPNKYLQRKKLVFLGTPLVAAENCLRILAERAYPVVEDSNYEIVAVVTQPPAPAG